MAPKSAPKQRQNSAKSALKGCINAQKTTMLVRFLVIQVELLR
jgi:hypothetical protein